MQRKPQSLKQLEKRFEQSLQNELLTISIDPNQCNAYASNSNTFQCPPAVRKWPLQMTALCIMPVLLSRHIKEFTDLHIEVLASGCSDLLLCHGSYPFFNTVFPRDTTNQVTSCMSLLSLFKGLRIQGSDLLFKDFLLQVEVHAVINHFFNRFFSIINSVI